MVNPIAKQTADMLALLPDDDLLIVNTLVKKLVVAWDPDFTKLTPAEKQRLDESSEEMENGEYYSESDVWN